MTISIFFDDGGVLNDNKIRGEQWKKLSGESYSSRFGGDPETWGEANHKMITSFLDIFWKDGRKKYCDYDTFYNAFKKEMVYGMFKETKSEFPKNSNFMEIFDTTTRYVIPRIRSAIPGVIESIKELYSRGFALYTAAGAVSREMKLYLEGMGILQYFEKIYGPDIINTWKSGTDFYEAIFNHSEINREKAIIIDDQPRFLRSALEVGANVIQACITGEFNPQFPYYVEDMKDLLMVIEKLIQDHNL